MTKLLIARHGNTFDAGDTILRVGARTDLPLSISGRAQAEALGKYLLAQNTIIYKVYTSELCRTYETAEIALKEMGVKLPVLQNSIFNEIDYGEDDGQPEEQVVARIGTQALQAWEQDGLVPEGWLLEPEKVIQNWRDFAARILKEYAGQTVLVVTSNGIARFAPHICNNFQEFKSKHPLKLATGALACFSHVENQWQVDAWNLRPDQRHH